MPTIALTTSVIDTSAVESLINLVTSVMGLFTTYPLNIYLIAGLVCMAFGIFGVAKRASKH